MKKDNSLLLRLDDEEARILNDGWFDYVNYKGRPVTKTEYIREALRVMKKYLNGDVVDAYMVKGGGNNA
jgi:hypothetical protein